MSRQIGSFRGCLVGAAILGASIPTAHAACPYMHQMFGQMQQHHQMSFQRQQQQQQQMQQQQQQMMQRQMHMQQQMTAMRQRQTQMLLQTRSQTQTQSRSQMGLKLTTMHRSSTPPSFHLTHGSGTVTPRYRTQVSLQSTCRSSMHMVPRQTTSIRMASTNRQTTAQRSMRTVTNRTSMVRRQTSTRQVQMSYKPVIKTQTSVKFGGKMTCGNCHTCKHDPTPTQPPPMLTRDPGLAMRPVSPMPQLQLKQPYSPPRPQLALNRPTPPFTMQMVPLRPTTPPFAMQIVPPRRYPSNDFDLPIQTKPYRPTPFDVAMERLIPKSSTKVPETSPGSTLLETSTPPPLPDLTPFLPAAGGSAPMSPGEKSAATANSRLPALLIVPASAALLQSPLLPELPEHTQEAPALPPLPSQGAKHRYGDRVAG